MTGDRVCWYKAHMATKNIQQEIQDRIESFVNELSGLVRQAGLAAVHEALAGDTAPKRDGRSRKKRSAPARRKAVKRVARKLGKRAKRSTAQVEAVAARILSHVKANEGTGVTEMGAALRMTPKEMRLPILRLVADKKLKTSGARRGTKYHAAGRSTGAKKKASKKRSKKKAVRSKTKGAGRKGGKKK